MAPGQPVQPPEGVAAVADPAPPHRGGFSGYAHDQLELVVANHGRGLFVDGVDPDR
ncbi:hypothetical protein SDC9_212255 [bioreactor metagenome]|uniref:Uncharacterized protein n=1 Tax=bioreactor metagenome TaxID=1076179 RepID=A0A645JN17_9ZZZZ